MTTDIWSEQLSKHSGGNNFYEIIDHEHKALFLENKASRTLVVTFDNLDDARQDSDRLPWGMDFVSSRGWSSLGLMAHGWTWYRSKKVYDFFDRLKKEKFFSQFDKVVFYGGSMGGYAATAFCSACPGSEVLAFAPQATLNRDLTSNWEIRFRKAWKRDFTGRYGFAPDQVREAKRVRIFYDPYMTQDACHAALYRGSNVEKYRCRFTGHNIMTVLRNMGVLSDIVTGSINGQLSQTEIFRILRARRTFPSFQKHMLHRLERQKRYDLIHTYCKAVLNASAPQGRPHYVRAMRDAASKLNKL